MQSILYSKIFKRIHQCHGLVLPSNNFQQELRVITNTNTIDFRNLNFFRIWEANLVLYKKCKMKQIFFLKRKLVLCQLGFVSKLMFYISESIQKLKKNTVNIKIYKPLLDSVMSFLSKTQKLTFFRVLIENYWTTLYFSTIEFFQKYEIVDGLKCNHFLIQCPLLRRFQFEVFSIVYLDNVLGHFSFLKLKLESFCFLSTSKHFLTLKMLFQYLFMSLFYFLNDMDCVFKLDNLLFCKSIQTVQKFRKKIQFKQYWFQFINLNVWSNHFQSNRPFLLLRLFLKTSLELYRDEFLKNFSIQPFFSHFSESVTKRLDSQIIELCLFSQFNFQFQCLLVNPKIFCLSMIHCYNSLNSYSIIQIPKFLFCKIIGEFFYFHPNKCILMVFRQFFQNLMQFWKLGPTEVSFIHSPQKWRNYWIYSLSKEFVLWQSSLIFPFSSFPSYRILNDEILFFQQARIQNDVLLKEKIFDSSLFLVPSKWALHLYFLKLKQIIYKFRGSNQLDLIYTLGSQIRVWSNYCQWLAPNHLVAYCDSILFQFLWRWSVRRHSNKSKNWIKMKYFPLILNKKWNFTTLVQPTSDLFFKQSSLFEFYDYMFVNYPLVYVQLPSHRKKQYLLFPKLFYFFAFK